MVIYGFLLLQVQRTEIKSLPWYVPKYLLHVVFFHLSLFPPFDSRYWEAVSSAGHLQPVFRPDYQWLAWPPTCLPPPAAGQPPCLWPPWGPPAPPAGGSGKGCPAWGWLYRRTPPGQRGSQRPQPAPGLLIPPAGVLGASGGGRWWYLDPVVRVNLHVPGWHKTTVPAPGDHCRACRQKKRQHLGYFGLNLNIWSIYELVWVSNNLGSKFACPRQTHG